MRIAILGTGLIGGSIGLGLRRGGHRVTAYDRDPAVAIRALERGAADSKAASAADAVADADVVFLCTPVGALAQVAQAASHGLRDATIVTDVGSTKSKVVLEIESIIASTRGLYIGGHPMAGTEEEGIDAASPALFEGAWWILTPTETADAGAYQTLHSLLATLKAQVMAMNPAQHDELMAVISHLPHLTAAALMTLAAERGREHAGLLSLAAGGFRDLTRVAASNPEIWVDICRENREAIRGVLDEFASRLLDLRDVMGDDDRLRAVLVEARESRRGLGGRPSEETLHHVLVPVPDRPGVLAEVTTLVGNLGVNIEDLEITHAEEGGRGTLRLTIAGSEAVREIMDALVTKGYEPRWTSV